MLSEGYNLVLCSGAEWLRDSTEFCSDVKKVVFFKGTNGHGLRTSTKGFFPTYLNIWPIGPIGWINCWLFRVFLAEISAEILLLCLICVASLVLDLALLNRFFNKKLSFSGNVKEYLLMGVLLILTVNNLGSKHHASGFCAGDIKK